MSLRLSPASPAPWAPSPAPATRRHDAIVIGAGFYGCEAALELRALGYVRVLLVDQARAILSGASLLNQARVHNGYHYPRSLPTASRSHANFEPFLEAYRGAITPGRRALYAIAAESLVNPVQFARVCELIGAACAPASPTEKRLFEPGLVTAVFATEEATFDARALRALLQARLDAAGVEVRLGTPAQLEPQLGRRVAVRIGADLHHAEQVFNCTYAHLDAVDPTLQTHIRKELAEIVLFEPPADLAGRAVTVMDGPFFSSLPFPMLGLQSLTHVRYTPHAATEAPLAATPPASPPTPHAGRMLRDAARYLPALHQVRAHRSLFVHKAVLARREDTDGRPILFEASPRYGNLVSVLGGKLDNVFDMKARLREHSLRRAA